MRLGLAKIAQRLAGVWGARKKDIAATEAIEFVAAEYWRRTGLVPEETPA